MENKNQRLQKRHCKPEEKISLKKESSKL